MVDAGSVFGSLAGLPHFPMSFTSISADFGLSIVTGAFFVQLNLPFNWQFEVYRSGKKISAKSQGFCLKN